MQTSYHSETMAAEAFTRQSGVFDDLYLSNSIIKYKRQRVRDHLSRYLKAPSNILELNSGTGEDATFFASLGHHVHATDISEGMLEKLSAKVSARNLDDCVSYERCSYTSLSLLKNKGPFDCIFSNFAGLNCTGNLAQVLRSFDELLHPGGIVTLVILPKFCLWEALLIFRGKFRTACRRFFSNKGRKAKIDDMAFTCWYYSPRYVKNTLKDKYDLLSVEGLCTLVPPSYMEKFAEKHPRTFSFLCKKEERLKTRWPFNVMGDYYIISLRKKIN